MSIDCFNHHFFVAFVAIFHISFVFLQILTSGTFSKLNLYAFVYFLWLNLNLTRMFCSLYRKLFQWSCWKELDARGKSLEKIKGSENLWLFFVTIKVYENFFLSDEENAQLKLRMEVIARLNCFSYKLGFL